MNPLSFLAHPRMPLVRDFTLAVLAVLGLFFALTVHGYEQSFYRQIIALFLLLTLIMVKLYGSYNTRLSLPGNSFSLWFSAFTGWVLLSMAWSPIPGGSFLSALTFSFGLLAMLLSFWANERQWFFFRSLLIPLALLVVAATSYQAFVLKVARPAGFLMNWNTNSAFLGAILLPYCAVYLYQMTQWPMDTSGNKATQNPLAPRKRATAVKLSRHTGMDCRYPEHREVNLARPPWPLGSGIPCRNDGFFLNLVAALKRAGLGAIESRFISTVPYKLGLLGLFLASCGFGMSLGQGRGSLFALAIGLAVLFFAYRNEKRAYWGIGLTLAWVVGGYALGDLSHGGMLAGRLSTMGTAEGLTDVHNLGSGREYLWAAGWRMYLDRPWLGWGIGLYKWLYPRYRSPLQVEDGHFAHNDYLQFLIELGPLGLLLCLAWVAALFWLGWRLFRATLAPGPRFTDLGLVLACFAMLLQATVDFHLYHSPMLFLLGAYAGRLAWRYSQPDGQNPLAHHLCKMGVSSSPLCKRGVGGIYSRNDEQKTVSTVLTERIGMRAISIPLSEKFTKTGYFSILTAITLFLGLGLFNLEIGYRAIRDVHLGKPPLTVFKQCAKARDILPFIEDFQSCQGWLILTLIKNEPDKVPLADRDRLIRYALQGLDEAILRDPISPYNHQWKAELLLLVSGNPDEIIDHLRQSLVLNPYQLDVRLELADTLEKKGDVEQAKQVLAQALGKAYIAKVDDVKAYWRKVDGWIGDTAAFTTQRQAVQQQRQWLDSLKPDTNAKKDYIFTLPDIGWKP